MAPESEDVRDELPEDLDPNSDLVGPYLFPDNSRRRVPGYLYLLIAAGLITLWVLRDGSNAVLVNNGMIFAAIVLALVGSFHLLSGGSLVVDEQAALAVAGSAVDEPIGHASAQMGWRGWRSRPTWRILWYSAQNPPTNRGIVLVDGYNASVVSWFIEANPEDWTELDGRLED